MAELRLIPSVYVEGSPWPPGDFNGIALGSLAYDENWQREHTDNPTGEHDTLRIAYAGGFVAYAGGTSYAVGPNSHVALATRVSAGVVSVKFGRTFRATGKWSVVVWAETSEPGGDVPVEIPTAKTNDTVQIRLPNSVDGDFYIFAYGFLA